MHDPFWYFRENRLVHALLAGARRLVGRGHGLVNQVHPRYLMTSSTFAWVDGGEWGPSELARLQTHLRIWGGVAVRVADLEAAVSRDIQDMANRAVLLNGACALAGMPAPDLAEVFNVTKDPT